MRDFSRAIGVGGLMLLVAAKAVSPRALGPAGDGVGPIPTLGGIEAVSAIPSTEAHSSVCRDARKQPNMSTLDTATNLLKNRVDAGSYHLSTVGTLRQRRGCVAGHAKSHAVVAEITPRVRHRRVGQLDRRQIMQWAHAGTKVRISGWLMLDPEQPSNRRPDAQGHPVSRGTIWEIHPVMAIGRAP